METKASTETHKPEPKEMTKLKKLIAESGYKKDYIAKKAGIQGYTLSKMINGYQVMPPAVKIAIAGVLDVEMDDLQD